MNNVNKIRRRSSGTLPMFAIELATWTYLYRLALCGDLDRAARLLDLLLRGGRCAKRLDRELLGDLALAEDLDVLDELGDQALGAQRVEFDGRAGIEHALERRDVDRERLDAERVLEPALGDPARHRHLTALEPQPRAVVARASLLALDALAGGLAGARAATATEALLRLGGAGVGMEVVQRNGHGGFPDRACNLARKLSVRNCRGRDRCGPPSRPARR